MMSHNEFDQNCYVTMCVSEALEDNNWLISLHEKLNQFTQSDVWDLVIGTKWIFKNKSNENGVVVSKKARLVAQGYT